MILYNTKIDRIIILYYEVDNNALLNIFSYTRTKLRTKLVHLTTHKWIQVDSEIPC